MEPGEALSTAAQIAVALAGFAGVVVVFRSGSIHEWSPLDRFRLWLLLGNAMIALFACLFGMLLFSITPTPLSVWRWCSVFSLLLVFPFGFMTRQRQLELGRSVVKEMGAFRYVFYLFGAIGGAVSLLQVYNALSAGVFWLFYASIVFPLAIGTLQFARMILLPPHSSKS
ncbi:MAG: hypothetical protein QOJ45_1178 [Verrucomicrobiota bacterium]|jgi:hypothetical protein